MPVFSYSAHGPAGVTTGELDAADRSEAFALLGRQRLQPFKLEQAGRGGRKNTSRTDAPSITQSEPADSGPIHLKLAQVALFTEELSDLLSAGIQLEPALGTM